MAKATAIGGTVALENQLHDGGYTCVLSDGTDVVTSKDRGVLPLIRLVNSGRDMRGYCAADKIVGKAAALLYARLGVVELYADVMSERAAEVCARYGIKIRYGILAPRIINRKGDGGCPMEQAVAHTDEPEQAVRIITEKLKSMGLM